MTHRTPFGSAPWGAGVVLSSFALACRGATSSTPPPSPPAAAAAPEPSTSPGERAHDGTGGHHPKHGAHAHESAAGQHAHGGHGAPGFHKDFSDAGGFAQHFDDPTRDAWQRPAEVIENLRIPTGGVVADLGAGTGYFIPWLSRAVGSGGRVLALDVEANMVEFVRQRAEREKLSNVVARRVESDNPGLEPNTVDRVLIVNTWHHLDQRESYARKLMQALTPKGEIWIVDFTLEAERGPPAEYRLAPERVVKELEGGGLRAEIVASEQLPDQYMVRAWRADARQSR